MQNVSTCQPRFLVLVIYIHPGCGCGDVYELTHQLDLKSTDYEGEAHKATVSELELILVLVDELSDYWTIFRLLL